MGSSKVDNDLEKISVDLKSEIHKFAGALGQLETDIALIQSDGSRGSYWSGPNAYKILQSCLSQVDYNHNLLTNLEKCSTYIDSLVK